MELMALPELERLKGIDQAGYGPFWMREKGITQGYEHHRFAHSVGVCLLLGRFGAPLAEQVSGLTHDVSHTAFSHCTEYVFHASGPHRQDYQDSIHAGFVRESQIPAVLARHGLELDYVLDDSHFPLKERNLPDLCADRIDYVLRDALCFGELDRAGAGALLDALAVEEGVWFFRDLEGARSFAQLFQRMNDMYYAGFASARMFAAVAEFVRYALEKEYITPMDLMGEDAAVVDKARVFLAQDERLQILLARMENHVAAHDRMGGKEVTCKSRAVDPYFRDGRTLRRLSERDASWKASMAGAMLPKRYWVEFER